MRLRVPPLGVLDGQSPSSFLSRRSAAAGLLGLSLAACTGGPGRAPVFPDAAALIDAGARDALPYPDAAPPDADRPDALVVLPDAGVPPAYPFTGVFGVLNTADSLFAREHNARLDVVITDFPYHYSGTIAGDGTVDLVGHELERAGCARARLAGRYDRENAIFRLHHDTCNASGTPLSSTIQGGFRENFLEQVSGVYELEAQVTFDGGCWIGPPLRTIRSSVNVLPGGVVAVFTEQDYVQPGALYLGQAGSDLAFSARFLVDATGVDVVSMRGRFQQDTANDPLIFSGMRDVWDPAGRCVFNIVFSGPRIETP